jgi:UDP-N-acetylglucosamine acyltransferase
MSVHPTAIVSPEAKIAASVEIGPFAVIEANVTIGEGCKIDSHAILKGPMVVGKSNRIHSHAVLGGEPQDLKFQGEYSEVRIGDHNTFREFVTVNRGTLGGNQRTTIGDRNLFMAYCHIAHDCVIRNHCVFANSVTLAGHIVVQDHVVIGGLCALHQHIQIGQLAMIAGGSMVSKDVPPFMLAQGDRAVLRGLNRVGLRRQGFSTQDINRLHSIYKFCQQHLSTKQRIAFLKEQQQTPHINQLIQHFQQSSRGVCGFKEI